MSDGSCECVHQTPACKKRVGINKFKISLMFQKIFRETAVTIQHFLTFSVCRISKIQNLRKTQNARHSGSAIIFVAKNSLIMKKLYENRQGETLDLFSETEDEGKILSFAQEKKAKFFARKGTKTENIGIKDDRH